MKTSTKKTQKERILAYLKRGHVLTTIRAFFMFKVCRLSERIRELEADGEQIERAFIVSDGKRYVAYSMGPAEKK